MDRRQSRTSRQETNLLELRLHLRSNASRPRGSAHRGQHELVRVFARRDRPCATGYVLPPHRARLLRRRGHHHPPSQEERTPSLAPRSLGVPFHAACGKSSATTTVSPIVVCSTIESSEASSRTTTMIRKSPCPSVTTSLPLLVSTPKESMRCASGLLGLPWLALLPPPASPFKNWKISVRIALRRLEVESFLPNSLSEMAIESWRKSAIRRRLMFTIDGLASGSTLVTPLWKAATPSSMMSAQIPAALKAW